MLDFLEDEVERVLRELREEPRVRDYIDFTHPIPTPYQGEGEGEGEGEIKLIILGQDPTVRNKESQKNVTCVLNLNRKGSSLYRYVQKICENLGLNLEKNVYATNFFKNVFTQMPADIEDPKILSILASKWLPVLKIELQEKLKMYPNVPVLTLGQPMLPFLICEGSQKVKSYWGHYSGGPMGRENEFMYCKKEANQLGRELFPFPHQKTCSQIPFYKETCPAYSSFCKQHL